MVGSQMGTGVMGKGGPDDRGGIRWQGQEGQVVVAGRWWG